MRRIALIALALGAALAAPGAVAALFDDVEARQQIVELKKRVDANQQAIEERLAKIEAGASDRRAILDLSGQIEGLRLDFSRLRGDLEVLVNQLETANKRQKDLYVDIDARLRKLEQGQQQAAEKPAAPSEPSVSAAETKAYEAALNQFKLGNYALTISAFQGFLVTYPSSPLAPSAQYWIGNAHYALHEYRSAIEAQQKVIAAWPEHAKAADAMLNIASSKEALGDKRGAQKALEDLVAKYPSSPAATSAKQRLAQPRR